MRETYRQEIYSYYLGKKTDPEAFIKELDHAQIHRQFHYWWHDVLPGDRQQPILDLGCGWGGFLSFLKAEGYTNLVGVDSSPQQIAIAQRLGLSSVEVGNVFDFLKKHKTITVVSAHSIF